MTEPKMIGQWKCVAEHEGTSWWSRSATRDGVEFCVDADGLDVTERHLGYQGGSGSYGVPAAVLAWLMGLPQRLNDGDDGGGDGEDDQGGT
jgi:hypothetical protein